MKVPSTAAALSLLGPDFRYETSLWAAGEVGLDQTILEGDLVLIPSGDPTFSRRFYPTATAPLDSLAIQVREAGIRRVTGSLVIDASVWDSTSVPGDWMVGNLPWRSAATGGAFAIGEGEIVLEVKAAPEEGIAAEVRWWPGTDPDFFTAAFMTTHPDSSTQRQAHYRPESRRLRVEGRVPAGSIDTLSVAQRNPVELASAALLRSLEGQGIEISGGLRIAWNPGEPVGPRDCTTGVALDGGLAPPHETALMGCPWDAQLASVRSPPLSEIVEAILEPSQNWMTEQLVRTLGAQKGERGGWQEGFEVERAFFTDVVGVDSLDLTYRDGSGLDAYNLVTPRAMVQIFRFMRESEHGALYRAALAEPGEEEGTLRNRLQGLEGRVFAKTGTITHVNSLSGYLVGRGDRELIFSILTNGSGLSSRVVRAGIDRLVQAVAGH
jgi:D-alanyl-D-alanine carboxypeptidase/D-alanyl-D-alanine-endopeptidase (penicillin-binding protein 4)